MSRTRSVFVNGAVFIGLMILFPAVISAGTYSGGVGTAEDPYKISTVADWQELMATSADWDKNFILLNDIDFAGIDLTPVAPDIDAADPFNEFQGTPFSGTFDGQDRFLRNVNLHLPDLDYVGLFGHVDLTGEIRNLHVEAFGIGRSYVGGIVGINSGLISSCSASGTLEGSGQVGGVAGGNRGWLLTSYSTCDVTAIDRDPEYLYDGRDAGGLVGINIGGITECFAMGSVQGVLYSGGLVGTNHWGTITSCYAAGNVSGMYHSGCLAGAHRRGTLQFCYASGSVYADYYSGGLFSFYEHPTTKSCFFDMETSGISSSSFGKTTAEMKTLSTFTNASWDFGGESANGTAEVWDILESVDYPRLAWETSKGIRISTHSIRKEIFEGDGISVLPPIRLYNYGHEMIPWIAEIDPACDWLQIGRKEGGIAARGEDELRSVVDPAGFPGGEYSCTLILRNTDTGEELGRIIVSLNVIGPILQISQTDFQFQAPVPSIKPKTQFLTLRNTGGGVLQWNMELPQDCPWLWVNPSEGVLRSGESRSIDLGADPTGLAEESFECLMTLSTAGMPGDPQTLKVGLCIGGGCGELSSGYGGGSGTVEDPFQIWTVEHWKIWMNGDPNETENQSFILMADLDLQGVDMKPIEKIGYEAVFDGNGHTIRNIVMHRLGTNYNTGLIGENGGLIRNLKLENVDIVGDRYVGSLVAISGGLVESCASSGTVTGNMIVGGLVGYNPYGTILSCHSRGTVIGLTYSGYTGGLTGLNYKGTIAFSYSTCEVMGKREVGGFAGENHRGSIFACFAGGKVTGIELVGGFVGLQSRKPGMPYISSCYATGDVQGTSWVGGFSGFVGYVIYEWPPSNVSLDSVSSGNTLDPELDASSPEEIDGLDPMALLNVDETVTISDSIAFCFSTGKVTGTEYVGGLVGSISQVQTVGASFWDTETSGTAISAGGTGWTTAEMKTKATFTDAGWDFVGESANGTADVWRMCANGVDYPRLSWEFSQGGDMACPDGVALEDLLYLAGRWMASVPETVGAADGNGDGKVDMVDLAILASDWMRE